MLLIEADDRCRSLSGFSRVSPRDRLRRELARQSVDSGGAFRGVLSVLVLGAHDTLYIYIASAIFIQTCVAAAVLSLTHDGESLGNNASTHIIGRKTHPRAFVFYVNACARVPS